MRLPRLRPDLAPLRDSRDFRLVVLGSFLSGLGAQATLVALPYQVYVQTRSALLVGLLGALELAPLIAAACSAAPSPTGSTAASCCCSDQIGLALTTAGLAAAAAIGGPPSGCSTRWRRCSPRSSPRERRAVGDRPQPRRPPQLRSALALSTGWAR